MRRGPIKKYKIGEGGSEKSLPPSHILLNRIALTKVDLIYFRWLDSAVGDGKIERTLKAVGKCLVMTILLFVMLKKRILYKKINVLKKVKYEPDNLYHLIPEVSPMMCKSKSGLGLDMDISPIFIENGLDLDLT